MGNQRYPAAERARLVAAFRKSGMTQRQFCDAKSVKLNTFQSWLYKGQTTKSLGFVRVEPIDNPADNSALPGALVVEFGDATVRFATLPSATFLVDLLRALQC